MATPDLERNEASPDANGGLRAGAPWVGSSAPSSAGGGTRPYHPQVEDPMRRILQGILTRWGAHTTCSPDAADALSELNAACKALGRRQTNSIPLAPAVHSLRPEGLQILLAEDNRTNQTVAKRMLEEVPRHMASLRRAIADNDAGAIEGLAHSLKGELGYLGIAGISQKAREMEEFGQRAHFRLAAELYGIFESEVSEILVSVGRLIRTSTALEIAAARPGVSK